MAVVTVLVFWRLNFGLPWLVLSYYSVDLPCVSPARGVAVLDSLLLAVHFWTCCPILVVQLWGFGSEETDTELLDSIPPPAWIRLSKGIRFVSVAAKEDV